MPELFISCFSCNSYTYQRGTQVGFDSSVTAVFFLFYHYSQRMSLLIVRATSRSLTLALVLYLNISGYGDMIWLTLFCAYNYSSVCIFYQAKCTSQLSEWWTSAHNMWQPQLHSSRGKKTTAESSTKQASSFVSPLSANSLMNSCRFCKIEVTMAPCQISGLVE